MGYPSSCIPSKWNSIASRMFASTSSRVAPVDIHPRRSGEYAENPVSVFSMIIKYLCMAKDDFTLIVTASRYCFPFRAQDHRSAFLAL